MKINIIAVGRLKKGPLSELAAEYRKRITWPLQIHEVEDGGIGKHIDTQAFVIALDERGKTLSSPDFAKTLERQRDTGGNRIQFIIGGADGLSDEVRDKSDLLLSFGRQTWPHLLARVMVLEQIYRAQQILSGHPYHRD